MIWVGYLYADISYRLAAKCNEAVALQERQGVVGARTYDLEAFIGVEQLRHHIRQRVWHEGKTLEQFLEVLWFT